MSKQWLMMGALLLGTSVGLFTHTTVNAQDLCPGLLMCSSDKEADEFFGGMDESGVCDGILLGPDIWGILLGADDDETGGGDDTGDGGGDTDGGDDTDDGDDGGSDDGGSDSDDDGGIDTGTCDPDSDGEPDTRDCPIIPSEDMTCRIGDIISGASGGSGGGGDTDGGGGSDTDGDDTGGGNDSGGNDSGGDTGTDGNGGGAPTIPLDYGGLGASPTSQSVEVPPEHQETVKGTMTGLTRGDTFAAMFGDQEHQFRVAQAELVQMGGEDTYQIVFYSLEVFGPAFTMVYDGDKLYLVQYVLPNSEGLLEALLAWWRAKYG